MNHTTIRIAIIILSTTTLMLAGTYFSAIVQHQAYSSSGVRHQVKSNEEAVGSSLQERSQHMDQENLCLRAGECDNSNVGEQILGNDNSVTGFTDQSKNIQAQEEVTPTATPTATPTPTPTPSVCNPSTVGGQIATPNDSTCRAFLPADSTPEQLAAFRGDCNRIPNSVLTVSLRVNSASCTFPSTSPT